MSSGQRFGLTRSGLIASRQAMQQAIEGTAIYQFAANLLGTNIAAPFITPMTDVYLR